MKRYAEIISLIIFTAIIFIFNLRAEDNKHGIYISSVVLTAPWGEKNLSDDNEPSKPGTFGLSKNEQGIECGPTAFTVAPNGDIYIGDALNERVQRFSADGNFIKVIPNAWGSFYAGLVVDKEGNIYSPDTYTANPKVYKFDQNGNQVMIYPIVKDEEMGTDRPYKWGGGGHIHCDDSNRIFIEYDRGIFQIGTKDIVFLPAQQKASWKEGHYGITSNIPNGNKSFKGNALGADEEANYEIAKDENKEHISIITKYDTKWRLLGTYTLDWSKLECPLLTAFSMGAYQVFDKGNLYVFCSDKDGLKIIKWSPVEGGK